MSVKLSTDPALADSVNCFVTFVVGSDVCVSKLLVYILSGLL